MNKGFLLQYIKHLQNDMLVNLLYNWCFRINCYLINDIIKLFIFRKGFSPMDLKMSS